MHPLVCYAASCSLYAWVLYIHHRRSLTMSTFISSPDDDDDDIMITLLLLAMCYPPVNRMPSFRESLTVDEVRRRSGKIRHHALQHPLSSPFWTLFNSKHGWCAGSHPEVLTRFTKFGQHKHKFWGYGYNDLCYNTHDIIIFYNQSAPTAVLLVKINPGCIFL